ncbi:Smr/MutS family protein [Pseudaestuariivita sp.]|uniref:Smr/MutS family protein n=1 Tax=Pseudaestuariivita sp. TaxID=2211669 RepID=UPI0040598B34
MPRKLRPDEVELWNKVAATTERGVLPPMPTTGARQSPAKPKPTLKPRLDPFELGSAALPLAEVHQTTRRMRDRLSSAPVAMDARTHGKMKRGKLKPEARIDLHGMTQADAHPALIGFVLKAHASGKRLVLVITGKGSPDEAAWPIPRRRGVLRQLVPDWLRQGPCGRVVLQVVPAHLRHGGDGAYYVYLKRQR